MKKAKNHIDPDKIKVVNIKTVKGNIDSTADSTPKIGGYEFKFGLKSGLDIEKKYVGLHLLIEIEAKDDADNNIGIHGSYTHEIVFKVENLDDFVTHGTPDPDNTDALFLDGGIGSTLVSIAYSTIRGIIYNRTQGTSLGTVILPIIDPKKLITNPPTS